MTTHQLMLGSTPSTPAAVTDPYFENVTMLGHFDGTNGATNITFLDSSTNNFTITRVGNTTQGSYSPYGNNWSNYFAGGSGGAPLYFTTTTPMVMGTSAFTMEAWIYPTSYSNAFYIIENRAYDGVGAGTYIFDVSTAGALEFYQLQTPSLIITSASNTIPLNTWSHVAVVRNSSSVWSLYVNGASVGTTSPTNAYNFSATNLTFIAFNWDSLNLSSNGYISNLRVVKGTAIYTSNFTPSTTPLTAISGTSLLTCQSNRFIDNSANNYAFTVSATGRIERFSPFSPVINTPTYGAYFDGSGDYLTVGGGLPSGQGTNFTLECFFYTIDATRTANVITQGAAAGSLDFYVNSSGAIKLDNTGSVNICVSANSVIQANNWYHIALTRNTSNLYTIYVNGVSVASGTNTTNMTANTTIGYHRNTATGYMYGYLSNFRVTNTLVYTSGFTPPTTPLTAISGTSLLTCQSSTFIDNSTNNFTITANGNTIPTTFSPFTPTYAAQAYSTSVIGGSGYFDGNGDYVQAAYNAAFNLAGGSFTVEAYIYITGLFTANQDANRVGCIMDFGPSTTNTGWEFVIDQTNNRILFSVQGVSPQIVASYTFAQNAWYHVAVVRNNTTNAIYVNGVSLTLTTNTYTGVSTTSGNITVGSARRFSGYNHDFLGYISNARIVKGTAVYTSNFSPSTAPLTAVTNTSLLLNYTNIGILDNAEMNDIEPIGGISLSTAATVFGTASLRFNGTAEYCSTINTPNLQLTTGDFTIECWVRFSSLASNRSIVSKGTSTTGWYFFVTTAGKLSFTYTSTTLTCSTTLTTGVWYYVSVVRSGTATGNVKVYLNGTLDGTSAGAVTDNFNQTDPLYIGANRTASGTSLMSGYIAELRITKGVARYTANYTTPTAAFPNQ